MQALLWPDIATEFFCKLWTESALASPTSSKYLEIGVAFENPGVSRVTLVKHTAVKVHQLCSFIDVQTHHPLKMDLDFEFKPLIFFNTKQLYGNLLKFQSLWCAADLHCSTNKHFCIDWLQLSLHFCLFHNPAAFRKQKQDDTTVQSQTGTREWEGNNWGKHFVHNYSPKLSAQGPRFLGSMKGLSLFFCCHHMTCRKVVFLPFHVFDTVCLSLMKFCRKTTYILSFTFNLQNHCESSDHCWFEFVLKSLLQNGWRCSAHCATNTTTQI